MIVTIRKPGLDTLGNVYLMKIKEDDLIISGDAIMAIDGSTTNTGIAILRKKDGALYYSCSCAREKGETPVQYKVRLKKFVNNIIFRNRMLDTVYYEEPFIGYAEAAKNLLMLRTFIEELIVENEPKYDYLAHHEINNMKWKRLFLAPDKCPAGTELQKAAVRTKLEGFMPYLKSVTQDEIDAISMGFVATVQISKGLQEELDSKKKTHPFQYNITFIGADDDDEMAIQLMDVYSGPKQLLGNGITLTEISGTGNFDKAVYSSMGSDDKIVIIKFSSKHHSNLVLKHRIGSLAASYDYLYAVVWRKTRKV